MAAIEYKPTMKKDELLELAVLNGVEADDGMTRAQIIEALEAFNTAQAAEDTENGPQDGAEGDDEAGEGNDPTQNADGPQSATEGQKDPSESSGDNSENGPGPAEGPQEPPQGYNLFVYAGPSLPRGMLKENAIFRGTFKDVKAYLADAIEQYPQIERLLVPADKLALFSVKVKTPGNIAHKYYNDIVSAMRGKKEV